MELTPDEFGKYKIGTEITRTVYLKGNPAISKFCKTCKIFRPLRSSHCSYCDHCVGKIFFLKKNLFIFYLTKKKKKKKKEKFDHRKFF